MTYAEIISIAAASMYALRTLVFMLGAWRARRDSTTPSKYAVVSEETFVPWVSVIVPARNEEANIERCVRSLMASKYPNYKFDVVVVNDRSTDRTGEILSALQEKFPNLIVHNTLDDSSNSNLQGKPRALHQGIMLAQGEVVMMTDADCTVAPTWIREIAKLYASPRVGLVAAFTVVSGHRFFDTLQMLEWMINNTMASAGVGLRHPLGCFGNNLSVRRSVYRALGGYENIPFSVTEDLALLQAVHRVGREIRYVSSSAAKVETMPCPDLVSFIKQHHRWINGGKQLGFKGYVFVASSLMIWIALGAALLSASWALLAGLVMMRILANMLLTAPSFASLGMPKALWKMPLAEPFFLAIELAMPFLAMKSTVEWKGQILRNRAKT